MRYVVLLCLVLHAANAQDSAQRKDAVPQDRVEGIGTARLAARLVADAADLNRDGAVTTKEWRQLLAVVAKGNTGEVDPEGLNEKLRTPMRRGFGPNAVEDGSTLVSLFDRNRDGAIQQTELKAVFARLDRDGDGALAAHEMPLSARDQARRDAATEIAKRADENKDGQVTTAEWLALVRTAMRDDQTIDLLKLYGVSETEAEHPEGSADRLRIRRLVAIAERTGLRWLDTNKDGHVHQKELMPIFARLDKNKDATLDATELGATPPPPSARKVTAAERDQDRPGKPN